MRSSLAALLLFASLVAVGSDATAAEVCPRRAIVRVETAVDPASAGLGLQAELASRGAWTPYQAEIARRLRVGGTGTGFFVNSQGYLVTNAHVLLSGVRFRGLHFTHAEWDSMTRLLEVIRDIWVTVGQGEEERSYLAAPIAIAEDLDLAILRAIPPPGDSTRFEHLPIGDPDRLAIGERIRCCGFAENEFQESQGEILSFIHGGAVHEPLQIVRRMNPHTGEEVITVAGTSPGPLGRLQHSAAVGHGSSGSPLLDSEGRVVGVGYAYVSDRRPEAIADPGIAGLNMAISSNVLKRFLANHSIAFEDGTR